MIAILVTGPHGGGKSTLVKQALAPFAGDARVQAIYADDGGKWKKSPEVMNAMLLPVWMNVAVPVLVLEGTHRIVLSVIRTLALEEGATIRKTQTHIVSQSPDVMRACLRNRCAAKGKEFEEQYWSEKRCLTDNRYYTQNLVRRLPHPRSIWAQTEDYAVSPAVTLDIMQRIEEALK